MAGSSIFLVNLTYSHSVFYKKIYILGSHIRVPWSSFPWQHQISVRELRHDRPSGQFSKSQGLSASVSFLSSPPPPSSFIGAIFDSRSSFFAPKPHRNACYAGYSHAQPLVLLNASYMIITVYVFTKTAEHKYTHSNIHRRPPSFGKEKPANTNTNSRQK